MALTPLAIFTVLLPSVMAMLDYRHFARVENPVPQASFIDPGSAPPSFVFAAHQLKPPYDIHVDTLEPYPGCDASYALLCSVQHAIRLVTQARLEACPDIEAGGSTRDDALAKITGGHFSAPGTSGFGVFVVAENGTILADSLRANLIGSPINGVDASGLVAQSTLLDYIDWVTRWGGGFVPHFSTRITKTPVVARAGGAPLPASAYFEKCSSGERIGVAFGRKSLPAVVNCNANANGFCALHNIRRLVGMQLVDVLNSNTNELFIEQTYKISYTSEYSVDAFYSNRYQLSYWGYPGPDPWRNPSPLPDTTGTNYATGAGLARVITGRNVSFFPGTVHGLPTGDWLGAWLSVAAWMGGAWQDYPWNIPALGDHFKVSLSVGYIFNGTGFFSNVGTVHQPDKNVPKGSLCTESSAMHVHTSSIVNAMRLVSHAQMDFLTPNGNFQRLMNSKWFGASHAGADDNGGLYADTFPAGFYVWAFDYNGTCVADGSDPSNVGQDAATLLGGATHTLFQTVADNGGGWAKFTANGGEALAHVIKLAKRGRFYYLGVSIAKAWGAWSTDCTAVYSEPCSESNAEVLVGAAAAEMLAATSATELEDVIAAVEMRTGSFSEAQTGNFKAHVYDGATASEFMCLGLPSVPCPTIDLTKLSVQVQGVLAEETGSWLTGLPTEEGDKNAYVYRVQWSPPTSNEVRSYFVVVFVDSPIAPLRCADDQACPGNAKCGEDGRCVCESGFATNFTSDSHACGMLKPASMECVDVRGVDCRGVVGGGVASCPPCAAGYFCPEGSPLPCPKGQYCPSGSDAPVLCPAGSFGDQVRASAGSACTSCSPGFFIANGGQTECEECPAGRFSTTTGATQCTICEATHYQPSTGATECLPCEAVVTGSRSQVKGSDRASDCVCAEGAFLDVGSLACEPCKTGMVCEIGSDMKHFSPSGSSGPVPVLEPGFWSSTDAPLSIFQCRSDARCPGGEVGSCGESLDGVACDKCQEGWYWDGDRCSQCAVSDESGGIFPVIPILVGFALPVFQYRIMTTPYEHWGSLTATAGCVLFVLLNHYQIVNIIGSTNVKMEPGMKSTYGAWDFTNDMLSMFKTACNGISQLRDLMLMKACSPIILGAMAVIDFFIARFLAKVLTRDWLRLDANCLFNAYGSVLFTFFGAIAAMSMELWKCMSNPNGKRTMFSAGGVICFESEEWKGMLGISIVAVVVYVLIAGAVMVHTVMVAPRRFSNETFRKRWKFLFERYRLGTWWFGLAFLAKNFLVNLALVIFSIAVFQFYFIAFIIGSYMVLVLLMWPYRAHGGNRVELACCASICLNCMFMSSFTFVQETDQSQKDSVSSLAVAVTWLPLAGGGLYALYCKAFGYLEMYGIVTRFRVRKQQALAKEAANVQACFKLFGSMKKEDVQLLYSQTGEYEHWLLRHTSAVLCSELPWADETSFSGEWKSQISTGSVSQADLPKPEDTKAIVVI